MKTERKFRILGILPSTAYQVYSVEFQKVECLGGMGSASIADTYQYSKFLFIATFPDFPTSSVPPLPGLELKPRMDEYSSDLNSSIKEPTNSKTG